jgi:broad specificity phosphatase PhoE
MRRLVLVRHGETDGDSSVRFHGCSDVELDARGREQMRGAAKKIRRIPVLVVASPLRRAWRSAEILTRGAPVRLEPDFREIDFGRWEGLTLEEIRQRDPILFEDWQKRAPGFEYPGGEPRAAFRERVQRGLDRLLAEPEWEALVVSHKGVIRTIVEALTRETLAAEKPALAEIVIATRQPDGTWFRGERSSDPPALHEAA